MFITHVGVTAEGLLKGRDVEHRCRDRLGNFPGREYGVNRPRRKKYHGMSSIAGLYSASGLRSLQKENVIA